MLGPHGVPLTAQEMWRMSLNARTCPMHITGPLTLSRSSRGAGELW